MTRLWIDVEDLFDYAISNPRPSGIQRLAFEVYRALVGMPEMAGRVGFLRHAPGGERFVVVDWAEVTRLFAGLSAPRRVVAKQEREVGEVRRALRRAVRRLPSDVSGPLRHAAGSQLQAVKQLGVLARVLLGRLRRREGSPAVVRVAAGVGFETVVRAGDVLASLGSPWFHPTYGALVGRACAAHGLRFMILVYDLIPLLRPEWCDRSLVRSFRDWHEAVLPLADRILAISRATAADVERYAAEHGIVLRDRVRAIPSGTGFGGAVEEGAVEEGALRALPAAGSYVLIVSTIEVRKNHLLLVKVWRRLLAEMPAGEVPTLVFAGRVGWMVADLMQQLENTGYLGGAVALVADPSDAELAALYRGCLFTLFPSFYEGWGLPVSESLAFGKPCIISDATSLPEVGGTLARYIDPEDVAGATRVIRATLEDRAGLAAWEARIGREFRPVAWRETAQAVVEAMA